MEKIQKSLYKKPTWSNLEYKELEKIVVDMAQKGVSSPMIGLVLRDQYGVPTTRVYGKKLNQILKDNHIEQKSDLENVNKKLDRLKKHLNENKGDTKSKRALSILVGRARKLGIYHGTISKKKKRSN